jgi:long-chain acyl-CoA synthetase
MKNFSTLCELVSIQASTFNNPRVLNFKRNSAEFISFSNQDFAKNVFHFACGLREIGLEKNQTFANISYQNPIWLIADLGAILAGATTVPIFSNISQENLFFEISDAKVGYVFTDNLESFSLLKKEKPELKIITYGLGEACGISFESLLELGKKAALEKKYDFDSLSNEVKPQDLATIIYTSGSTGRPKGVELTHQNLVSQIKATAEFFPLQQSDIVLSFLPLAHIFERMVMMFYLTQGASIYFVDDIKNLGNFLREVHPTLMTSVPRMLEKVFIRIKDGTNQANFIKKYLGTKALQRAIYKDPQDAKNFCDKIYDALIYKKFRAALGGRMRMVICGGAALSLDLQRFYQNIGVNLFCGYGLTETSPVISANCPKAHKFGTVGKSYPQVEIKISADGELLVRGPNVMRGYFNDAKKTAESLENGWFKTGDIAEIDAEGFLKITGRKKEIFKNANGKFVSPILIEQKLVQEIGFLIGAIAIAEGRQFTSALLFPDFEFLEKTKKKFNFSGSDEEFLATKILQNHVAQKVEKINKNLDHWEKIQKFKIIANPISIESGDITPSMKLKRKTLEEKFKNEIENFYQ